MSAEAKVQEESVAKVMEKFWRFVADMVQVRAIANMADGMSEQEAISEAQAQVVESFKREAAKKQGFDAMVEAMAAKEMEGN